MFHACGVANTSKYFKSLVQTAASATMSCLEMGHVDRNYVRRTRWLPGEVIYLVKLYKLLLSMQARARYGGKVLKTGT